MKQTASQSPRGADAMGVDSIGRLVEAASRLRLVRGAQRRFIRLWAEERLRIISRELSASAKFSPPRRRLHDLSDG